MLVSMTNTKPRADLVMMIYDYFYQNYVELKGHINVCIRSFRGLAMGAIHLYLDMTGMDLKFCGYRFGYFLNGCESGKVFNLKVDIGYR